MKKAFILSVCASLLCHSLFAQKNIYLIRDRKAEAAIILKEGAGATETYAAEELIAYVKKITGVELPVVRQAPDNLLPISFRLIENQNAIEPEKLRKAAAQLQHDGFILSAGSDAVQILSLKKRGLLYGMYHMLREYGGIIWFHPDPTDEGEFVPQSASFSLPAQISLKNPAFAWRKFTLNGGPGYVPHTYKWFLRNGMQLFSRDIKNPLIDALDPVITEGGHDMTNLLVGSAGKTAAEQEQDYQKLFAEHPEYFGMINGKRVDGGNHARAPGKTICQPCTSNPEVLRRMGATALREMEKYGTRENIRVLCNDDHTNWCECENCRKLDHPGDARANRHATRWWHYANYMAEALLSKEHPNRSVNSLVYQTYRFPPAGIKPDPRVAITICPHQRCYIHSLTNPDCPVNASTFRPMFEAWHKAGMQATTFEYHTQMPGATRYLPMEKAWIDDLRFYKKLNMSGFGFVTRSPFGHYGKRNSPFNEHMWMSLWQQHWLTAYFSWNLQADFEQVNEKINAAYYGKTWPAMKTYREELQKALYAPKLHMGYGTPDATLGQCLESPGLVNRLHDLLANAEKMAGKNELLLKRVRRDREFLKLSWEDAYAAYKAGKTMEYHANRLENSLKIDGILEEEDWKTARFATDFVQMNGKPAGLQTFARVLFDDSNLYFGIEAMKAKSAKVNDGATENGIPAAMRGSHMEIFLTPPRLNGMYYHFGFSHNGKIFQALTSSGSSRDENIKIDFEVKIRDLADRWVAEVKAPLSKLIPRINDGESWKINIARSALTEDGTMELSSWSGGTFHGSSLHRSVAFGKAGPIVRNGDFEELTSPALKKDPARNWQYLSEKVPAFWHFNENNRGKAELRNDNPASGKYYLRIEGVNAFVGQHTQIPKDVNIVDVSMRVRGQGELYARIYGNTQPGFLKKIDSPEQWTTFTGSIEVPENPGIFWLRITGTLDLDNLLLLPAVKENLPTAEKHR